MRMHHLGWMLSVLVALTSRPVHGYFSVDLPVALPYKSMMATAARNNAMILFGGGNATHQYTSDLYQLTSTNKTFTWNVLSQNNAPPAVVMAQGVYVQKTDSFVVVGGSTAATANQTVPLQVYSYYFSNQTWVAAPTNLVVNSTAVLPINRVEHSIAIDQSSATIFIYGGAFNSAPLNDFWAWDVTTMTFTQLPPNADAAHYGHAMSLLSTGKLVVTGGVQTTLDPTTRQMTSMIASLKNLYVFDLTTRAWTVQTTTLSIGSANVSGRQSHVAVVTARDQIVIYGGHSGGPERTRIFTSTVGILSTDWVWTNPDAGETPPSMRAYASGAILAEQYLTVAFGTNVGFMFNDINVLDLNQFNWLQSYEPIQSTVGSTTLSSGAIAGIAVGVAVFVIILLFLLWKFRTYLRWLVGRVHQDIWRPRSGEPLWAETARFCSQIFMLFLFAVCLAFIVRQAVTSPNVTQRSIVAANNVNVPDIRFCYDGYQDTYPYNDSRNITVGCKTDNGYSCNSYISKLDNSIFVPVFADYLGPVTCFLFRAPTAFTLSATSGLNNGSRLIFSLFGDTSISNARIHISAYPKAMNPNSRIYNIIDDTPTLLSDEEVSNWRVRAINDFEAPNIFTIEPFTYSVMTYNMIDHRYLQDDRWNYVGFLPNSNHTPKIETTFRQEAPNPIYNLTHKNLGIFTLSPETFAIITDREVKVYTLINAIGFIGGIFGILVAVQTWLFGYRPQSPWGVVQRWSVGDMRQSLLQGLSNKFRSSPEAGIPLINPVHSRFSRLYDGGMPKDVLPAAESEEERVGRVEERMQVLELLFKAYYVNDEVFRSLDNARRGGEELEHLRHRRVPQDAERGESQGLYTDHEKLPQPRSSGNSDDGFSHLFNERQPSAGASIDNISNVSKKKLAPSHVE